MRGVWWCRRVIYRFGGRPKPGSIWYSPSLSIIYAVRKAEESSR